MLDKYLPLSSASDGYFNKYKKLPLKAAVRSNSEPFHWHDEMELICVIHGVIEVHVNNKFYLLKEDEIILLNDNDMHRINVGDDSPAFISIHLDLKYIEETLPDISYIWYSCNPTVNTSEKEPAVCRLRSRLAQILLELKDKSDFYENRILLQITSILTILINNFNLIGRDPESYQNTEQFERVWSIIDYIYINSAKKITLKDVANHVHLSDSYLSHSIKDNTGMSFEDLLNYFRAEISIKMLLTSNLSITKISYDCGFSDIKYYNKYFKRFFNCSPIEYRNKNRLNVDISLSIPTSETITYDDFLMGKLRKYISEEQPDKGFYEDVVALSIDLLDIKEGDKLVHYWKDYIDVGDMSVLLDDNTQWLMYDVQDDIKFIYLRIHNVIGDDYLSGKSGPETFDWKRTFDLLDFVKELCAYPMLVISMECFSTGPGQLCSGDMLLGRDVQIKTNPFLKLFMEKCSERFGESYVNNWYFFSKKICSSFNKFPAHPLYDTAFMAPYFISHILQPAIEDFSKSFAYLYDSSETNLFNGALGILTMNGLKKPLYHAYHFLSCMGDTVLKQGNNYIITKRNDNIQILLYNLPEHVRSHPIQEIIVDSSNRYADFAQDDAIHFNITIHNLLDGEYIVKQYKLDRESGSIFDKFIHPEAAQYLSARDTSLLNSSCYPKLKVSLVSHSKNWNIKSSIAPNSVEFITIKLYKKTGPE